MHIYVYVDEFGNLVEYFTNIEKFKKKYDNILICHSKNNQKALGYKKIHKLINEYGHCNLYDKENWMDAGYLKKVKEGK